MALRSYLLKDSTASVGLQQPDKARTIGQDTTIPATVQFKDNTNPMEPMIKVVLAYDATATNGMGDAIMELQFRTGTSVHNKVFTLPAAVSGEVVMLDFIDYLPLTSIGIGPALFNKTTMTSATKGISLQSMSVKNISAARS